MIKLRKVYKWIKIWKEIDHIKIHVKVLKFYHKKVKIIIVNWINKSQIRMNNLRKRKNNRRRREIEENGEKNYKNLKYKTIVDK